MNIQWITDTTATQLVLLAIAFVLSAAIGLERQHRLKAAGLKTHCLVGLGSALFTLVSAYGFATLTDTGPIDPTRIAAQIVSGIGFIGAGVIFVRHDSVSGLTTAASVWVTAAIGMACGAGLPLLAGVGTALYLLAVTLLGKLGNRLHPRDHIVVVVRYREGIGALRNTLAAAASQGYEALVADTQKISRPDRAPRYQATIQLRNTKDRSIELFLAALTEIPGVTSARRADDEVE